VSPSRQAIPIAPCAIANNISCSRHQMLLSSDRSQEADHDYMTVGCKHD
jgi:hypothetical protein